MQRFNGLIIYSAGVAIVLLAYGFLPISPTGVLRELSRFDAQIQENIALGSAAFILLSAMLAFLAFPSMPVVYVAAGYCFGSVWGATLVLLGSGMGGLAAFFFYRKHLPDGSSRQSHQLSPLRLWMALLGLRLSPIVPAPVVTFFAAFFSASTLQYATTTLIGSAPLILFYGSVGEQARHYVVGAPVQWWVVPGYLAIIAFSTALSLLGPWRSFLDSARQLKNNAFASASQAAGAN